MDDEADEGWAADEPLGDVEALPSLEEYDWYLSAAEIADLSDEDRLEYMRLVAELEDADDQAAGVFNWTLDGNPKQQLAHAIAPRVDNLLYGGAAGGGKSELLCYHAFELSMKYPGHDSLLLRTTLPQLRRTLIRRMQKRMQQLGIAKEVKLRRLDNMTAFYLGNGSIIEFGFAASDDDVPQFLSAEYDFIGFDEATKFTPYALQMISSRARTTRRKARMGVRPHVMLTTNPGGRAHVFLRKLAIDSTEMGKKVAIFDADSEVEMSVENVVDGKISATRTIDMPTFDRIKGWHDTTKVDGSLVTWAFIQSLPTDNQHVDPGYVRRLKMLPEIERRQQLNGDWNAVEGAAFPDFQWDVHRISSFEPPASWHRATGTDWGFAAPACTVWIAWDQDGNAYVYRESKLTRVVNTEQAKTWKAMSTVTQLVEGKEVSRPERIPMRLADPAVFSSNGTGTSIGQQWANAGWRTMPANNNRSSGWANVHDYLAVREETGRPRLFIMECCPYLIETIGTIQADPHNPEDVDTKSDDHALDALRYGLLARPLRDIKSVRQQFEDTGDALSDALHRRINKFTKRGR